MFCFYLNLFSKRLLSLRSAFIFEFELDISCESGDDALNHHLKNCAKNATYMSPEIQNELIDICAEMIKTQILNTLTVEKKFYSVIADATSDITGTEQLSLTIRFLCYDNGEVVIKEDFIGFTPIVDNSAKGISTHVINYLRSVGLDLTYLRGKFLIRFADCVTEVR